jgi:hypothetical protein
MCKEYETHYMWSGGGCKIGQCDRIQYSADPCEDKPAIGTRHCHRYQMIHAASSKKKGPRPGHENGHSSGSHSSTRDSVSKPRHLAIDIQDSDPNRPLNLCHREWNRNERRCLARCSAISLLDRVSSGFGCIQELLLLWALYSLHSKIISASG